MKKTLTFLVAASLMLSLAACGGGGSGEASPPVSSTPETGTPESTTQVEARSVGDTIKLDFVEITIDECGFDADLMKTYLPANMSVSGSFDPQQGKQFVFIKGTMKALSTSAISNLALTGNVKLGDYTYAVDSNGNGEFALFDPDWHFSSTLEPLSPMTYIIAAFVPDELVTDHDSCVLTFGFKEMFDSADYEIFFADDPLGECDYAYSVDIDANAGVVAEGTPAEEEPIAAEELTLGQAYQTNDYEVTINGFSFGAKAEVVLSSGSITSKSVATADAGSTFILIDSTVKYLGTETISLRDTKPFSAYALYDDTYTYEEHFTFVGNKEIAPLQTQTQVLPVGIPQELESDDGPLSVFITIGDSVYQYVIR